MAHPSVVINSVTYPDVPSIQVPLSGASGNAEFFDTSDATLDNGGKMLSGNTAYANGVKYTGSIATKTGTDISASGDTVTVPAGYYASQQTKAVAAGSATAQAHLFPQARTRSRFQRRFPSRLLLVPVMLILARRRTHLLA